MDGVERRRRVFDALRGLQIAAGEEVLHAGKAVRWPRTYRARALVTIGALVAGQLLPNVPPYSKLGWKVPRLPP